MDENTLKNNLEKYTFKIYFPGEEKINPNNESVDLIVNKMGKKYTGTLMTLNYLNNIFNKNKETGECANGSYFCMERLVIVNDLKKETIKKTLDGLIETGEFKDYFRE